MKTTNKTMKIFNFTLYTLILSHDPCDVFKFYKVTEMHGLNAIDCAKHKNTTKSAYFAGWSNFVPKKKGDYKKNDSRFVFINLSRCTDDIHTMGLIMHEMMHQSFHIYNHNTDKEEEIITWAEEEAYKVFELIKKQD